MTPNAPQYGSDSELQADVMRFMAIIAFCLIAILALVRNVTPAEPSEAPPPSAPEPVAAAEPAATEPEPVVSAPPAPAAAVAKPQPAVPEPVMKPPPAVPAVAARPAARTPPAPPADVTAPPEAASLASEREGAPASESAKDEGLTLRFASDGDFLRLIARGDIKVYAYREQDVLTLNESYQFLETRAPGQVYELLDGSVPTLVMDALRRTRASVQGYHWGVVLPGRISHQIENYLGRVDSGQLVIDRFGDVRHVAAT